MPLALLLAYVAALIILASLRTLPVRNAVIQRLRAPLPSWRFFDDIGDMPVLWVRLQREGDGPDDFGPWQLCLPTPTRTWSLLLWNPAGNLRLAYDSLLMHLMTDADEHAAQLSQCVSYQLTEQLVAFCLQQGPDAATIARDQFKFTSVPAGEPLESGQDAIMSPVLSR